MELDDLKDNWKNETIKNLEINKQSMEQLQIILKEKTSGTLTGVKKNFEKIISLLLIGILLNILINPFLYFLLGEEGPVFKITFSGLISLFTIISICLITVLFYWLKFVSFETVVENGDLKLILKKNIAHLKKSLQHEICFIITIFISIFIIGRTTSQYLGNGNFWDIFKKDIMLALLAALLMMSLYIYLRVKHYKRNTTELQKYLDEIA